MNIAKVVGLGTIAIMACTGCATNTARESTVVTPNDYGVRASPGPERSAGTMDPWQRDMCAQNGWYNVSARCEIQASPSP